MTWRFIHEKTISSSERMGEVSLYWTILVRSSNYLRMCSSRLFTYFDPELPRPIACSTIRPTWVPGTATSLLRIPSCHDLSHVQRSDQHGCREPLLPCSESRLWGEHFLLRGVAWCA